MATIIVNAITHRAACTDGLGERDLTAYDDGIDRFLAGLAEVAAAEGFGFEVDTAGQGGQSYRVTDEMDYADLEAAHRLMQSPRADFWAQF